MADATVPNRCYVPNSHLLAFTRTSTKNNFTFISCSYVNFLIPYQKEKQAARVVPKGRSIRVGYAKAEATQVGLHRRISIESTQISLFVKEDEEIVYGDQYTCCPPPLAIMLITLLELAFFIVG